MKPLLFSLILLWRAASASLTLNRIALILTSLWLCFTSSAFAAWQAGAAQVDILQPALPGFILLCLSTKHALEALIAVRLGHF